MITAQEAREARANFINKLFNENITKIEDCIKHAAEHGKSSLNYTNDWLISGGESMQSIVEYFEKYGFKVSHKANEIRIRW
jgi:hypothetical protein